MWYRTIWAGVALRVAGLICLGIAIRIGEGLFGHGARIATALDYLGAAIGFLAASVGAALTLFGPHLFDQVELAPRHARLILERRKAAPKR